MRYDFRHYAFNSIFILEKDHFACLLEINNQKMIDNNAKFASIINIKNNSCYNNKNSTNLQIISYLQNDNSFVFLAEFYSFMIKLPNKCQRC